MKPQKKNNPFRKMLNFLFFKAKERSKRERAKKVIKSIIPKIKALRRSRKSDCDIVVTQYISLILPDKTKQELSYHYFSMLEAQEKGLKEEHNFKQYCLYIYAQIEGILNALFSDEDFEKMLSNIGTMPAYMKEQDGRDDYIQKYKQFPKDFFPRFGGITMAEYLLNGRNDLEDANFVPLSELAIPEKFQIFLYVFKYKFCLRPTYEDKWNQTIMDFYLLRQIRNDAIHPNASKQYAKEDQEKLQQIYANKEQSARNFKTLLNRVITWFEEYYPLSEEALKLEYKCSQDAHSEYYY